MVEQEKFEQAGTALDPGRNSGPLAVILALLLALATGFFALRLKEMDLPWLQPGMLGAAGLFVFAGLMATFGWLAGILRFNGRDPERLFFDSITDGMVEPIVVTDDKGRAIYANAPYLKLASRAGVSRLVGFDVLYAFVQKHGFL